MKKRLYALLTTAIVSAPAMLSVPAAHAKEFKVSDDVSATANITASIGASIRTSNTDSNIISPGNAARNGVAGVASSATSDDGTLNFDKGDVVTAPITIIGEIDLNYKRDYGLFFRGKFVHDLALENHEANHGHSANGYDQGGNLDDSNFDNLAQFTNVALLDAFGYGSFEVADRPLELRVGRQVISWGESAIIQGGINTINPVDVTAFRRPGVNLKEGLLPLGSVYANLGVTDAISVEGFWNFEWGNTVLDGCGTFFSTNDVAAQGCNQLSLGSLPPGFDDDTAQDIGLYLRRSADEDPDIINPDNFGLATRYFADEIGMEFGAYFTYLDSRTPNISYTNGTFPFPGFGFAAGEDPNAATYFTEYAEDIVTLGLSAATEVGGIALAGEISYRPNHPVQINTNDLTTAAASAGNSAALGVTNPADVLFQGKATGDDVEGYVDSQQVKGQMSAVGFIDRAAGADRITLLGEIGFEYLDIENPDRLNLGRDSAFGNPGSAGNAEEGLITNFSSGYRLRASATYSDVFYGVNVIPTLAFAHDVYGYSSDGQFNEGRTAIGVGVGFDYLNRFNLGLNYSNTLTGDFVTNKDRDFVSINFSTQY